MIYDEIKGVIKLSKNLNELDKFVRDFTSLLKEYVIVSGYVSILLGRTRATEDVDLLVPEISLNEFNNLWKESIKNGFWCINTPNPEEAYNMLNDHAIRFCRKNQPLPNIEFKRIKNELDRFSFENKIKVLIEANTFYISPLELQIAYKLFLGSEKDIEDARHLYKFFKDKINKQELHYSLEKLKVENKLKLLEK
ncbi:hypothetical protein HY212_07565 [Candidatus Pacearchaeota archaeon]|nr:hypothetical protein [Candidatus Pacearchaeota archaeon]